VTFAICFVCSGNICRSPSAEVVMRALLEREGLAGDVDVCSAGIGDWHVGEGTDGRSLEVLTARGYDGSRHRARQFRAEWFGSHDLVVAMDRSHLRDLKRMAGPAEADRVRLMTSFGPAATGEDVPDPYYGGPNGFTDVLDLIELFCRALLDDIRPRLRG
jgi:protein-tyrosine phosphatase